MLSVSQLNKPLQYTSQTRTVAAYSRYYYIRFYCWPGLRLTGEVCVEWAGLRLSMYRYQTAAARCARWQLANWCRRAETPAARRAATADARPMGAFPTGVPVDWGLSQRPARVDCGLSYTTGQATIALRAIVACNFKVNITHWHWYNFRRVLFGTSQSTYSLVCCVS